VLKRNEAQGTVPSKSAAISSAYGERPREGPGDIQSVEVERPWLVLVDPLRVSPYVAEQGTGLADFELEEVLQGGALAKFDAQRVWSLRPCCHRAKLSQTKQHA